MDPPLPPIPHDASQHETSSQLPPLPGIPSAEVAPSLPRESIESGGQSEGEQDTVEATGGDTSRPTGQDTAQTAPEGDPSASNPSTSSDTSQGETWVDFLRSPPPSADTFTTGIESDPSQAPQTNQLQEGGAGGQRNDRGYNRPLPQLPQTYPPPPPERAISREGYDRSYDEIMADKKRRLTATESPERRSGQGPSHSVAGGSSSHTNTATRPERASSGSSAAPIDLTSPRSRPAHPVRPHASSSSTSARRHSDVVLPKWQPDSDVAACPVCNKTFTFFNRKHHCRKCGRVVCASCSPHRITIPRQFIVHPPALPSAIIDLTGEDPEVEGALSPPRQLWGGEEVRVCNPCVPDPNLSPPPQGTTGDSRLSSTLPPAGPPPRQPPRRHRRSEGPLPPVPQYPGHRATLSDAALLGSGQDPFHNRQLAFTNPTTVRDLWPPTLPPQQHHHPVGAQYVPSYDGRTYQHPSLPPGHMHPPRTSSTISAPGAAPPPYGYSHRSLLDVTTPLHTSVHPPPPQRRQIAEEDECPVCGHELPPKGANGDTSAREAHVTECITEHSYSNTPPVRTHSAPGPPQAGASVGTSIPTTSPSSVPSGSSLPASSYASASGTQRHRRMTASRMLVYDATEKDCVGEDGEVSECVICFEEFEAGDEMGRLECLCRFHRACIRQWWDTKGIGSCPTHQLHE